MSVKTTMVNLMVALEKKVKESQKSFGYIVKFIIFHWIRENFDLFVAVDEKPRGHLNLLSWHYSYIPNFTALQQVIVEKLH